MSVDGTYKIEIDTPMGKQEPKLTLKSAGDKLSGNMENSSGKIDISGGAVKGNEVSWSTEINSPMGKMKLDYKGKVAGNDISGEVKAGDFSTFPFKGKKI